jgi:SAM-dependent methyltransferase
VKYHDVEHGRLIQVGRKANAEFWDDTWSGNEIASFDPQSVLPFVELTKRFLPIGSTILEGGCGTGGKVAALTASGYRMVGVDYAPETVSRLNRLCPEFDIRVGDVFQLDFPEGYFDGYWSFGVIEHFWTGYHKIIREAHRVIRDQGYLFLTFPCMSPLRKLKAEMGFYKRWQGTDEPEGFYQFILPVQGVAQVLASCGFEVEAASVIQIKSGVKQELQVLWKAWQIGSRLWGQRANKHLDDWLEHHWALKVGHLGLLAARVSKRS